MIFKWKKQLDDIAHLISKKDVYGVFSKSVVLYVLMGFFLLKFILL